MKPVWICLGLAVTAAAHAQLLSEHTFDTYASGTELNGLDGWLVREGATPTSGLASVTNTVAASAPHAARLSTGSGGATRLSRSFTQWSLRDPGNDTLRISVDVFIPSAPLHVVTIALPQLDNMRFVTWNSNASTQQLFAASNPGSAGGLFNLNKNQWNTLEFRVDGLTGNTAFYANGGIVGARILDVSAINNFDFEIENAWSGTEVAIDNLRMEAVPEPMTMALLATGLALAARRRQARG